MAVSQEPTPLDGVQDSSVNGQWDLPSGDSRTAQPWPTELPGGGLCVPETLSWLVGRLFGIR